MPKQPKQGQLSDGFERQSRSQAEFYRTSKYDKALDVIKPPKYGFVIAHIARFENEWKQSQVNEDLLPSYQFKTIEARLGAYRICQIYVGRDHRAIMMFPQKSNKVYWIHIWKKTAMNDHVEIEKAKDSSKKLWESLGG